MDPYRACPCGSGKKFKFCCRDKVREQERTEKLGRDAALRSLALREEELDRLDDEMGRGLDALDDERYEDAAARFEALIARYPLFPGPHVHLAEARYGQGRLAEVAPLVEQHLRLVGEEDALAWGLLARSALYAGKREEALRHAERLWSLRAIDADALRHKVFVSAIFHRDEDILRWVERWTYPDHPLAADFGFFAGVAAANLGRTELALASFETGFASVLYGDLADLYHERLDSGRGPGSSSGRWAYFMTRDLIPLALLERWIAKQEVPSAGLRDFVIELLDDACGGDADGLALLGAIADEPSVAALRHYAAAQAGSFGFRSRAVGALHEAGALTLAEPIEVWTGSSWCTAPGFPISLRAGVPPEESYDILVRISQEPLRIAELLADALARDPDDWFTRLAAVRHALLQRGPDAALARLEERPLPSEAFSDFYLGYGMAQVSIALERADLEAAAPWVLFCARVCPDWSDGDLDRAEVEDLFDREGPFDRAAWEQRRRSRYEQELSPRLSTLLHRRTWSDVRDFASAHRVLAPATLSRYELIERICSSFEERGFAPLLEGLTANGRDALGTLHLLGGALPLESFEVVCEDLFLDEGCAEDEAPIQVLDLIDLLEARALLAIGPPAEGVHVAVEGGEVAGPGEMCVFLTKEVGDLLDTESAHA